jgi:predicted HNH restriction endonuclease
LKSDLSGAVKVFDLWYQSSKLKENEECYKTILTYQYLSTITDNELKEIFCTFAEQGGMIMYTSPSYKNAFQKNMEKEFDFFRQFILMPHTENFSLKIWFDENNNRKYFGLGTASVYLNRVNRNKYPVYNGDTGRALNRLGFRIYKPNRGNYYQYYTKIIGYQKYLLNSYPILDNFYKIQAFCWFLLHTKDGNKYCKLIRNDKPLLITDEEKIYYHIENEYRNKEILYDKIIKYSKSVSPKIIINSVSYKRDNYQMALIKKYHDYECQFCSTRIKKKNGQYYIEACHINAKAKGGNEEITNILILCPNCHKLLDVGDKKEIEHSQNKYIVELNGVKYTAFFEKK